MHSAEPSSTATRAANWPSSNSRSSRFPLFLVQAQEKANRIVSINHIYTYIYRAHAGLGDNVCVIVCEVAQMSIYFLASSGLCLLLQSPDDTHSITR